ncbi:nucleotidyltransferase domain-containing protein [Azospirillum sp. SYSU D00513]|uniref:GSU2403 family nucleotidyltransferase fold protein n=1 Tax=Azospirillum sp. SYSU D00513 TaxID=2812561 RepID=UPI001A964BC3|nr:nucleotidyltransferase domain-containing protein [Azospirillum sp. SYSU D00513]
MSFSDLTSEQTRQLIDTEQIFGTWRTTEAELKSRYAGSMHWQTARGREYLYRKIGRVRHSLGPRSPETEKAYAAHTEGRERLQRVLRGTAARLNRMAPVNKALGLGRVPTIVSRIVRRLDEAGLLGRNVRIAGTHALFAYERLCGVHVARDLVATDDVDLLYDHRTRLRLTIQDLRIEGIMGVLRQVDDTFTVIANRPYAAANRDGFMVDLITPPESNDLIASKPRSRIGKNAEDLAAAEVGGLAWLVNSPSFEGTAIAANGFPVRMVCPDPRAWAVHKLWLSERDDRDALKRGRDRAQGLLLVGLMRERRPDMPFESLELSALPRMLFSYVLGEPESGDHKDDDRLEPDW